MVCPQAARRRAVRFRLGFVKFWLVVAGLAGVSGGAAWGQTLDLSLNLLYANPSNPNSGGTWQLAGKSSDFGIAGVEALISGISAATAVNEAPFGIVNNTDPAGFFVFNPINDALGFTRIIMGQGQLGPGAGEEEALFYGVGTLQNGAPDHPGKPMGTNSLGPVFTSLTNLQNGVWASVPDFKNDPAWNTAAILASGTFAPGATPSFFSNDELTTGGSIFTSLGSSSSAGDVSFDIAVSTIVRDNLSTVLEGDFNGNGAVENADLTLLLNNWGAAVPPVPAGWIGHQPTTPAIDNSELTALLNNWGVTTGTGSLVSGGAVPEPATWLLATIVAWFACGARRKRN